MASVFLAVVAARDPAQATDVTLYFGSRGLVTSASDTPADTYFEPRITNAALLRRDLFDAGTTIGASRVAAGDLVLANPDGALDYLLGYVFDGRDVTIYYGEEGAAFPGGYTVVLTGSMEQPDATRTEIRLKLRDRQADLEQPVQATHYAGDNVLPDGLEGTEELAGRPKPLVFGSVRNIQVVPVNTSKLIYQVNDGAVDSIPDVRDKGVSLRSGFSDWSAKATGATDPLLSAVYSPTLERWVTVGDFGKIITSDDDGETWTTRTSASASLHYTGVRWIAETALFVACGWYTTPGNQTIASSADGITWGLHTTASTSLMKDVAYNGTHYVAVGYDGVIQRSTDLSSWSVASDTGLSGIAPTFSAVGSIGGDNSGGSTTTRTTTITVPDVTDGMLTVEVAIKNTTSGTVSTVSSNVDGAFTLKDSNTNGTDVRVELWYLLDPTASSHTITVTLSAASRFLCVSRVWQGVNQTTPFGTVAKATGTGTDADVTVTSASDELAIDVMGHTHNEVPTGDSPQVEDAIGDTENATTSLNVSFGVSHQTSTASVDMGWSWSTSRPWAHMGVSIKPSTTASATYLYGVVWANGKFTAVGQSEAVIESTDGDTWTALTGTIYTIAKSQLLSRIIFDADSQRYWVVSFPEHVLLSSIDGIAWTPHAVAHNSTSLGLIGVAVGGGYVGGLDTNATFSVSADLGGTWTRYQASFGGEIGRFLGYGNGRFIGLARSGVLIATSQPSTYATEADLLDDDQAPAHGTYAAYPAGGMFRLGSNPAGEVTADVVQGATAADRTAAQLWTSVLAKAGKSSGDWSASDVTTLDGQNATVCGVATGLEDVRSSDLLTALAQSVGAWWGVDQSGVYRIKRLEHPGWTGSSVASFIADEIIALDRVSTRDQGAGLPAYRVSVLYNRNNTVQHGSLAYSVNDALRADYSRLWRTATATDLGVQTLYPRALELEIETALTTEAGAEAEAARVLALRDAPAHRYIITVKLTAASLAVDLGDVITLTHPRFDLDGGARMTVVSIEPDGARRTIRFGLWYLPVIWSAASEGVATAAASVRVIPIRLNATGTGTGASAATVY